ncbi:WD repeat-containing protein 53-like [Sesbania bispinosa]|nr:WD repeat-containing protein 53-like [Sesbania bispinosa]
MAEEEAADPMPMPMAKPIAAPPTIQLKARRLKGHKDSPNFCINSPEQPHLIVTSGYVIFFPFLSSSISNSLIFLFPSLQF